jgi:putative photosynthetic complex assembly protein
MTRAVLSRTFSFKATPHTFGRSLSRAAPGLVIAAIMTLAAAIVIGEWRDGTLGVQRVVDVRSVVFEPRSDGTLAVHLTRPDGAARRVDLPSASEGFVATMAKSLGRERRRFDVNQALPYQLSKFENGAFMLKDPVIGTEVRLEAFGPTNVGAFAALM